MKALFIVNERSGKKRGFDVTEIIRSSTAFDMQVLPCGRKEDLDAMIDGAERDGVDVVFAVGGDGTVHETAKRLIGRKPALGILPIGSGNGFARHIGLPLGPAAAIEAVRGGRIETIDTAEVNGHPFLGVMGIGFDAVVADRFATSTVRGFETYVKEGLRVFAEYQCGEYEIDGEKHRAFLIAIANSSQYGNNARIAPLASLQDGLLDIVIVHDLSVLALPILLARLFTGSLHRDGSVTMLQRKEVHIVRPAEGPGHLDGEPFALPRELHVRIVPRSLRLLVPDATTAL